MSSAEPHSACVLAVRSDESQMVGLPVGAAQLGRILSALVDDLFRIISPGAGDHGFSIVRLCRRIVAALIPLYKNVWSPWPTWFEVPSHSEHPTVQPLENQ